MKTTQEERDKWRSEYSYPGADTGFIALLDDADELARLEAEIEKQAISCAVGAGKRCPYIHAAEELARLREELKGLERVSAAAPLTGVAELVSDPNGEAVLYSDVLALLEGDE